jgi:hypothetical protein
MYIYIYTSATKMLKCLRRTHAPTNINLWGHLLPRQRQCLPPCPDRCLPAPTLALPADAFLCKYTYCSKIPLNSLPQSFTYLLAREWVRGKAGQREGMAGGAAGMRDGAHARWSDAARKGHCHARPKSSIYR